MAASAPGSSSSSTQEYTVRIPKDKQKKFSMMKFGTSGDLDFAKLGSTTVSIARENNLREFKTANDIDLMPKFGAGSEFGREQKEEARRKKYGRIARRYNADDQPWTMKIGTDKKAKRYKGVREGTITENTSYYIFTQCADGAFEAYPVDEWYNFTPVIKYRYLNSDEAEEHFNRREKTVNYWNIMVKKRMKTDDDGGEEKEEEKKELKNTKKSKKEFMLTDKDEDLMEEDEEGDDEDEEGEEDGEEKKAKKKKNQKKVPLKKRKNAKINSDDEAVEESDEGDYDDREVDYMSDSSSNPSEKEDGEKEKEKDEEKGVAEEDGLRVLIDSEAEEEEEENAEKEENEIGLDDDKKKKKDGAESDSSSSSSASDSDIDKDESINSVLFMTKAEKKKADSRPATPNIEDRGVKRKQDNDSAGGKKPRTNSPVPTTSGTPTTPSVTPSLSSSSSSSDGITEEAIRRYLTRKPMTTKDLLTKFRSKKLNMTSDQMMHTVAQLLKKINPEKKKINNVLYLSLKKIE